MMIAKMEMKRGEEKDSLKVKIDELNQEADEVESVC